MKSLLEVLERICDKPPKRLLLGDSEYTEFQMSKILMWGVKLKRTKCLNLIPL